MERLCVSRFWLTVLAALAGLSLVMVVGGLLIRPPVALILNAGFADEVITPNADGDSDITSFSYELSTQCTGIAHFRG